MRRQLPFIAWYGLLFLLFFQTVGTLVESVYMMDLLHSSLDAYALGILFLLLPLFALPFMSRFPRTLAWTLLAILLVSRAACPWLSTAGRVLGSGFAAGAAIALLLSGLRASARGDWHWDQGLASGAGLGLAIALSVLLRSAGKGLDPSLVASGGWIGVLLVLPLAWPLSLARWDRGTGVRAPNAGDRKGRGGAGAPLFGIYTVLAILLFTFTAPSAIARWTEGDYPAIVALTSLVSLGWGLLALARPRLAVALPKAVLVVWNAAFALALVMMVVVKRVPFPPSLGSPELVVGAPTIGSQALLYLAILLMPVLFVDASLFAGDLAGAAPSPRGFLGAFLAGSLLLIVLVFAQIFTNVWGYIRPVSLLFRNLFWLHLAVPSGILVLLALFRRRRAKVGGEAAGGPSAAGTPRGVAGWPWALLPAGAVLVVSVAFAWPSPRVSAPASRDSIRVMTFNTQQSNDVGGQKAVDRQLALIREVSPDIVALQETDSTRISLDNNDYVRYFAEKLGYHSYYGPTSVTGTYGTAILSKYPLENTRTVFMYSDKDETGTAEAEVVVDGRRITIYDSHPDSSDPAMEAFARTLVARAKDKPYAVLMGDYNLRDYEAAYQTIDAAFANAWTSTYPTKIGAGVDMSGKDRIDHIFVSASLDVRDPRYVKPPESGTDHAVHWTDLYWKD